MSKTLEQRVFMHALQTILAMHSSAHQGDKCIQIRTFGTSA